MPSKSTFIYIDFYVIKRDIFRAEFGLSLGLLHFLQAFKVHIKFYYIEHVILSIVH